eukprot:GHVS01035334.1.p1 GENE.GHVS01035334.1~~GHVS01035334.1.p1  ORF type:complete len:122 (+),score=8.12 GHVS01035334.1:132-497(+)
MLCMHCLCRIYICTQMRCVCTHICLGTVVGSSAEFAILCVYVQQHAFIATTTTMRMSVVHMCAQHAHLHFSVFQVVCKLHLRCCCYVWPFVVSVSFSLYSLMSAGVLSSHRCISMPARTCL